MADETAATTAAPAARASAASASRGAPLSVTTANGRPGLHFERFFTRPGAHPYDELEWELRDAVITNWRDGSTSFEQRGVEFPSTWSMNATTIVAQKYFRGQLGTPERERSVKQMIDRVADTITGWGRERDYFVDEDSAEVFNHELKHLLVNQQAAFNSPVWFNVGVEDEPQCSACFILSVEDTMSSILNWYVEEGTIFKGGSGSGLNLSSIRSSKETLKGGGEASGPVSFMRGADASAGTIKSGGKTRRAAKMVILNVDHPDVEEFIWTKAHEEKKVRALREAGFDMDLDSPDYASVQYQNANNSVRVTDEFMRAWEADEDYDLRAVTTGEVIERKSARDVMRQISQAAWECADPGLQYDTTINDWHTTPESGRINGSNPCCFAGETLVETADGLIRFDQLEKMARDGRRLPTVRAFDLETGEHVVRQVTDVWEAGRTQDVVEVMTRNGLNLVCTPDHRFLTGEGSYVEAQNLAAGQALRAVDEQGRDVADAVRSVTPVHEADPVSVFDLQVEGTHNFAVTTASGLVDSAVVVHNSEYMHLDNSACNLASLNLKTFYDYEADRFDVEAYKRAVEVIFTAQEIIVGPSSYPTEKIGQNARDFRELGLGYSNLGSLLMSLGHAYDSDEGRAWAGALTSVMTGHAYRSSAETARVVGSFAGYAKNEKPMLRVIGKHRDAVDDIDPRKVPADLLEAARTSWDEALELGTEHGYRNSQATVIAPTGCLVGGTLVPTERGLVRLQSLGDPAGDQWQPLDLSVSTDEGSRDASRFYVNGLESVVEVTTQRGHRIKGTPQHRVKVVEADRQWAWKRFGDVAEGDLVPLALDSLVGQPQRVTLPPLAEAYWRTGERHAVAPREMDADLAELLGYFMGDGSLHARGIRLCVAQEDADVVDRLTILGKQLFNLEAHVSQQKGYLEVAFHSVRLVEWWEAVGFAKHAPQSGHTGKGWHPHLPEALLHTNDRRLYAAFLRGLFEADGTVTSGYPRWASSCTDFSHDVQSLMLTLGYPTTRKIDTSEWGGGELHWLRILNMSYSGRWLDEVGFMGDRKNAAVQAPTSRQSARKDHIPITRELVDRVAPDNGRSRKLLLMGLRRSGSVSRRLATEVFDVTGDAELGHLLEFFYDRVATAVLGEDELTYDLSVPDNVTYVANGFVSHNTISFLMDCDTTGLEPDLGLVKTKKLVGGGSMSIVNQTVPSALDRLGYTGEQAEAIIAHIDEHKTIYGAPALREEHVDVFSCAMGDNAIGYMGHIRMMGAIQPFISGALSKTVNLPEEATVADIEQLHHDAWKLGIKAIAIYRDNCKVAQPLSVTKKEAEAVGAPAEADQVTSPVPMRRKLPKTRPSQTISFRVGEAKGYITAGEYPGDGLGEIFVKLGKQGSTLSGLLDAFAISMSIGLQYGVPLEAYVSKFMNMRFEPAGLTDDEEVRFSASLVDYLARKLAIEYLPYGKRERLGIFTLEERTRMLDEGHGEESLPATPSAEAVAEAAEVPDLDVGAAPVDHDAPMCFECGIKMTRAGACHVCESCGTTSGCS